MKKQAAAWAVLCGVALCAGLLLGVTNALTQDVIAQRTRVENEAARRAVFPDADLFAPVLLEADAPVEACYEARKNGAREGYVCTVQTQGYGGVIEVIVGVDTDGRVTGISVGGSKFSETVGLGAKTKDAAFTDPFKGTLPPLTVKEDVDAVTGATISSSAVVRAVNTAAAYAAALL